MKSDEKIVVAGMSIACNIGIDLDIFLSNLQKGYTKVSVLDFNFFEKYHTKIGGKLQDKDITRMKERVLHVLNNKKLNFEKSKETFFSLYCVNEIMGQTVLKEEKNINNIGLIIGSGCGCINSREEDIKRACFEKNISPLSIIDGMSSSICGFLSIYFNLKGPSFIISSACSSSTHAIGMGFKMLQSGVIDSCICGGVDCSLADIIFKAWDNLRVMTRENQNPDKAMKPFSKNRKGFILSEGAGYILLTKESIALKKKYPIYAEIIGYGATSDASHITRPDSEGQAECIKIALDDARVNIKEIDYINAHGTSTTINDIIETRSIKKVFGKQAYNIPVSSTKSMIGHVLGATGAIELIASILCMNQGIIHPTINYEPDKECDLFYVPNILIKRNVDIFLKNSFAFGGSNACLVVRKYNNR